MADKKFKNAFERGLYSVQGSIGTDPLLKMNRRMMHAVLAL